MKYNYPPIETKCEKCLGCNRLEDENFKGIWRCKYFIEEAKDKIFEDKYKLKIKEIKRIEDRRMHERTRKHIFEI